MSELVREWLEKAEGDSDTAKREVLVKDNPNWDAVCFHAQQAVEKYLKALLQKDNIPFQKIHDLAMLLEKLLNKYPEWQKFQETLEWLSAFAIEFRYPGEFATKEEADKAVDIMNQWRSRILQVIDIKS